MLNSSPRHDPGRETQHGPAREGKSCIRLSSFPLIYAPIQTNLTPCSEEAACPREGLSPPHLPISINLLSARLCGRRAYL